MNASESTQSIIVFADGREHEIHVWEGMPLSFDYQPQGRYTPPDRVRHAGEAKISRIGSHTVLAEFREWGGPFHRSLVTRTVRVFARPFASPVWKVDERISGLRFA